MHAFTLTTRIAAPVDACCALSLSVDAHTRSMGNSNERAIAGVTAGELGPGESVTWSGRHFGIRFRLTSRITEYDRPARFVDTQIAGPFASWRHEHEFIADGDDTIMIDRVEFAAPFGLVGRAVERLVLGRYMERRIRQRNEWLTAELERTRADVVHVEAGGAPGVHLTGRLICETHEQADIVAAHLPLHVQLTRAEQGCVSFAVEPSEEPFVWRVSEHFVDRDAFAAHQKRVAESAWGEATAAIARDYEIVEYPVGGAAGSAGSSPLRMSSRCARSSPPCSSAARAVDPDHT